MENKTDLTINVTSAIDKIAEKLGMGAGAIIPEYILLEKIRGIVWIIGGILLFITSIIFIYMLWPDAIAETYKYEYVGSTAFKTARYYDYIEGVITVVIFGGLLLGGSITMILSNIERIAATKAIAIQTLLRQIR